MLSFTEDTFEQAVIELFENMGTPTFMLLI